MREIIRHSAVLRALKEVIPSEGDEAVAVFTLHPTKGSHLIGCNRGLLWSGRALRSGSEEGDDQKCVVLTYAAQQHLFGRMEAMTDATLRAYVSWG